LVTIKLYGLKNCDSCRSARGWLDGHGVDYLFMDIREHALDAATLARWCRAIDWSVLLNRRSTTWRSLSEPEKQVGDAAGACRLMLEHPTLLKRPVLDGARELLVGFRADEYTRVLG
jgi:arsenate reductase